MRLTLNLCPLLLLASCAASETQTLALPAPPPALVERLSPMPLLPGEETDAALGQYIVSLRAWARDAGARYGALVDWATK